MLRWLLLVCLLPQVGCSRTVTQDVVYKENHSHEEVAVTTRPHIYYCRSRNMEVFSCWWRPLDNLTDGEPVSYVLTYTKDKGPKHECPDYVTAGPNSCHFDSSHTSVWTIYCMNVTAVTAGGNYSSQEHCLDVAEIVETEAPVNLTYTLKDAGGDEMGHNVLLSWTYPVPSDLQYGWITLVYELQYRRVTEPNNWKVKHPLREPHVELLGLPVGDFVVRVRCRSHNHGLWSKWSSNMLMSIPARPPAGKLLVWVLVSGIGIVALLVIAFGVIPQSKRIKDYLLPPIPKPRIIGIDPLLLKKGNLDEINNHLSNFHSYRPPSYAEEVWEQVNTDFLASQGCRPMSHQPNTERDALMAPSDLAPMSAHHPFTTLNPTSYIQSLSPYCFSPPEAFTPPMNAPSPWSRPEIVTLPGTDYSMMGHPGLPSAVPAPDAPAAATHRSQQQDFYTCVQLMNESGEVHLVPCLPPAYCLEFPPPLKDHVDAGVEEEEKKKFAEYQAKLKVKNQQKDGGEAERSKAADPQLYVAVNNQG